jgi:hypothetical protein
MNAFTAADKLHRLVKRAMDSGAAQSRDEAEALLRGYRLSLSIDRDCTRDPHHQSALLTAVALGRRVFLGGVIVQGELEVPLTTPLPFGATLQEAVVALGATPGEHISATPLIAIGGEPRPQSMTFQVRTVFEGWRGGIVPAHAPGIDPGPNGVMALAPMLAAALAVNEAFLHISGDLPTAGRRFVGLDLWALAPGTAWLSPAANEPVAAFLPSRLWLIGLGHLGQAYLWGLGLLPYAKPDDVHLVLQDDDVITPSTESTSILSDAAQIGMKKTRIMAAWAERRGFRTTITERLFNANVHRLPDEPGIALCGLDNAVGRRALDHAGFDFVVEAGLGRGHNDFRSLLVHTLPGEVSAANLWKDVDGAATAAEASAYRKMLDEGSLDRCGVTLLAGKAVGAPFVGAVAATLVLSEVLRLLHGGPLHRLIDTSLIDLDHMKPVAQKNDFSGINPGFTAAKDGKPVIDLI